MGHSTISTRTNQSSLTISQAFYDFLFHLHSEGMAEKTIKNYVIAIAGKTGLMTVTEDITLTNLTMRHVTEWRVYMHEEGLKPTSINTNISKLRQFILWLKEEGYSVDIDPGRIKYERLPRNKQYVTLTSEEINRMVEYAPNLRDKAIIRLFGATGCRSHEILSLDRDQWAGMQWFEDDAVWELWVEGKNKKWRAVYFSQDVKRAVDEYVATRTDMFKPLFISSQNRRVHWDTIGRMLNETAKLAGIDKHVTQHVFRHSYVTEMSANGMPLSILSYNLGHADPTVTAKVYTHINSIHARRAYKEYRRKV